MPSGTFAHYEAFGEQLLRGVHDFDAHTFKVALTNAAPAPSGHDELADISEIAAGNGYTAGGTATSISLTRAGHTTRVIPDDVTFTAAGGSMGTFQWAVLYNDTSSGDKLIGYIDYQEAITLVSGQYLLVDFNAVNGAIQMTTG